MTAQIPLEEQGKPGNDAEAAAMLDQEFTAGTLHILREAVLAHAAVAGTIRRRRVNA